jgi:hypothetical protein
VLVVPAGWSTGEDEDASGALPPALPFHMPPCAATLADEAACV